MLDLKFGWWYLDSVNKVERRLRLRRQLSSQRGEAPRKPGERDPQSGGVNLMAGSPILECRYLKRLDSWTQVLEVTPHGDMRSR